MSFIVAWISGFISAFTIVSMMIGGTEIWFGVGAILIVNLGAGVLCRSHHQKKDQFWRGYEGW